MTVCVTDVECMRLPEVGERLRESVSILPGSIRVLSWVRGTVPRRGGAGKSECLVHKIETNALAKNVIALAGGDSLDLGVPVGKSHEDLPDLGGGGCERSILHEESRRCRLTNGRPWLRCGSCSKAG